MPTAILLKLLAIFAVVALGFIAGRARWAAEGDVARVLSNAAFTLFVPALLFRTTARIDFASLPWSAVVAFFAPLLVLLIATYLWQKRRAMLSPAGPSVRAITVTFGNNVQLGIPIAAALYGEAGLAVHIGIVSLHALTILTVVTALAELDIAHARSKQAQERASVRSTLAATVRNTVIHPVVLPVIAGLGWNLLGLALPTPLDDMLTLLAQAAVPLCLVIIGMSFAHHGLQGLKDAAGAAGAMSATKLLLLPTLVFVSGYWIAGLRGVPLAVIVMAASLPCGANALIFAQRYETLVAETTVAIVLSTLCFVATGPLWLLLLGGLGLA
jgi:malonate transporter